MRNSVELRTMSIQNKILAIESNPDGGFERFTNSAVTITNEIVDPGTVALAIESLDSKGKKVFRKWVKGEHEAVRGIARVSWKSSEEQARCIKYQRKRPKGRSNRWLDVEKLVHLMQHGPWDDSKPGPIFIHPTLTGSHELKPVDGARRIMAHIEVGHGEIDVIVFGKCETAPEFLEGVGSMQTGLDRHRKLNHTVISNSDDQLPPDPPEVPPSMSDD